MGSLDREKENGGNLSIRLVDALKTRGWSDYSGPQRALRRRKITKTGGLSLNCFLAPCSTRVPGAPLRAPQLCCVNLRRTSALRQIVPIVIALPELMHQLLAQLVLAIVLNDYVLTCALPVWVRRSFLARGTCLPDLTKSCE
jgi:hypothetical protein